MNTLLVRHLFFILVLSSTSACFKRTPEASKPSTVPAAVESAPEDSPAGSSDFYLPDLKLGGVMNGIDAKEAAEFWNKWRLVTTRYRPDNGEQRFTYANPVAWKAIEQKKKVYPAGAMFAKIAFLTKPDPAFPNSLVPASFARAQLMKKMKSGFESSDSWSYALYLNVTQPQSLSRDELQACHACHRLVPERDFVFSTPAFFEMKSPGTTMKEKFSSKQVSELHPVIAENLRALVPDMGDTVQTYEMLLFIGSLQESIGPLTRFASEAKSPYLLVSPKVTHRFLLAVPRPGDAHCKVKVVLYNSMGERQQEDENEKRSAFAEVFKGVACDGVFQWDPTPVILPVTADRK